MALVFSLTCTAAASVSSSGLFKLSFNGEEICVERPTCKISLTLSVQPECVCKVNKDNVRVEVSPQACPFLPFCTSLMEAIDRECVFEALWLFRILWIFFLYKEYSGGRPCWPVMRSSILLENFCSEATPL